jgi:ABC-2 type transport system ATP-binding protein
MMIDFKNVSYSIPNGQKIYKDLNLRVYANEYYGVLGKNGAGKSTLIEMIMGSRKLESGEIKVFGEDVSSSGRKNKNKVFMASHDMEVPGNISVRDLLDFYAFFYPDYSKEIETKLLNDFEILPKKKFGSLSTGQKVKAVLCAAFAAKASLYLFDEVTAVLDPKSRRYFFKFLNEFRTYHSCSVFLATNIAEDLEQCMDKILFIDDDHRVLIKGVDDIDLLFEDKDAS